MLIRHCSLTSYKKGCNQIVQHCWLNMLLERKYGYISAAFSFCQVYSNSFDLCHCGERTSRKRFQPIIIGYSDCQSNAREIFVNLVGDPARDRARKTQGDEVR